MGVTAAVVLWASLAVGPGGAALPGEGQAFVPFCPDRSASITSSEEGVSIGRAPAPFDFVSRVEFPGSGRPSWVRTRLPVRGEPGSRFRFVFTGTLEQAAGEPLPELWIVDPDDEQVLARSPLRPRTAGLFRQGLAVQGGRALDLMLRLARGGVATVRGLSLQPADLPAAVPAPSRSGPRPVALPASVRDRNALRYAEVWQRDLLKATRLGYLASVWALWLGLAGGLAWLSARVWRRRRPTGGWRRWLKPLTAVCLAAAVLLLAAPAVEWGYRLWLAARHDEPAFLAYPLGFDTTNPVHVTVERDNTFRFDDEVEGLPVPRMTAGMERSYRGTHFYRARVNEAGYRGERPMVPEGARVVFCVGGSATYGLNADDETFPAYLQAALDAATGGDGPDPAGRRWVVFNLGVPGIDAARYLGRLKHVVGRQPDYVVLYAGFNDIDLRVDGLLDYALALARGHALWGPAGVSLLCRDLLAHAHARDDRRLAFVAREMGRTVRADLPLALRHADAYAATVAGVLRWAQTVEARVLYVDEFTLVGERTSLDARQDLKAAAGTDAVERVALLPQGDRALLLQALMQLAVRRNVAQQGLGHVRCVEPLCFEGLDPRSVLVDWVHLSAQGNRALGEFVAGQLLAW